MVIGMAKRPPSLSAHRKPPGPRKSWASTRTSRHARGYGWEWEKKRAALLAREPLCRPCRAAGRPVSATQVDHIKAKAVGGTDDDNNLQPLCEPCHKVKTAREANDRR
jgi:5-methylcytosine-specific restriction enzyme A